MGFYFKHKKTNVQLPPAFACPYGGTAVAKTARATWLMLTAWQLSAAKTNRKNPCLTWKSWSHCKEKVKVWLLTYLVESKLHPGLVAQWPTSSLCAGMQPLFSLENSRPDWMAQWKCGLQGTSRNTDGVIFLQPSRCAVFDYLITIS